MLLSENWLRQWVSPKLSVDELAATLTMGGFEVGRVEVLHPDFTKVVVGQIAAVEDHPRRPALKVCTVDVGRARALSIVCGATNATEGLKVPVALVGARLAGGGDGGGREIHKTRIGEVVSSGMICSASELGLDEQAEGVLVLDAEATVGTELKTHLQLPDHILDISLTPNRGDCLGVCGIAREVAALTGVPLRAPVIRAPVTRTSVIRTPAMARKSLPVRLDHKRGCPRYVGRIISGINNNARTPDWMRERLRRAGLRSLGVVVDITNYVMLELGQPMHAFDLTRISGGIVVRPAMSGETLTLLDGRSLNPLPGTMLIADHDKALALGGIMGGADSAVRAETTDILFEAACFDPMTVAADSRGNDIHTDASFRFERGVDPALQEPAMQRATQLALSLCGGAAGRVVDQVAKSHLPTRKVITLRAQRLSQVLGQNVPRAKVETIMRRLGMHLRRARDGWRVTPPSHRYDLELECDLIEEVARINGYEQVPVAPLVFQGGAAPPPRSRLPTARLRECMVGRGYHEAITYSFVNPELQALFELPRKAVRLVNPIASNMRDMRTTLWPGLLQALVWNYSRQHRRIRLFEVGAAFELSRLQDNGVREQLRLAAVVSGDVLERQWGTVSRPTDLFDLKGDMAALFQLGGTPEAFQFRPATRRGLHDGQCARITRGGTNHGWVGRLAPEVERHLDLEQAVYVFEMTLEALLQRCPPRYRKPSAYPSVRRDLSVYVDESVSVPLMLKLIRKSAGVLLCDLQLFDLYRGESVDNKTKSASFGLTFQSTSRTLVDEEIEQIMNHIRESLVDRFPVAGRRDEPLP